jgi:hypothetical protein
MGAKPFFPFQVYLTVAIETSFLPFPVGIAGLE